MLKIKLVNKLTCTNNDTSIIDVNNSETGSLLKHSAYFINEYPKRTKELIYSSIPLHSMHYTYYAKEVNVLVWVWPTGELLTLLLVGTELLLHTHQFNWVNCYPFIRNWNQSNSTAELEMKYFEKGPDLYNLDYLGGRDHWGHFFMDFFPQRLLSNTLRGSDRKCLIEPLDRYRSSITKSAKYLDAGFNPWEYARPTRSRYFKIQSCRFTSMSHPVITGRNCLVGLNTGNSFKKKAWSKLIYIRPNNAGNRIQNIGDIDATIKGFNFETIDPVEISKYSKYAEVYAEESLVITFHGSCTLNPLLFSRAKIICLYPYELFFADSHCCDIEQFSSSCANFGSRIWPIYSEKEDDYKLSNQPNAAINKPCYYDIYKIRKLLENLIT